MNKQLFKLFETNQFWHVDVVHSTSWFILLFDGSVVLIPCLDNPLNINSSIEIAWGRIPGTHHLHAWSYRTIHSKPLASVNQLLTEALTGHIA